MDIRMPDLDGLEAARRILAADAAARVIVLTTFDLDEYVFEALSAGASGFVLKDDPPEQLLAAIRTVARGDALLSPAVTNSPTRLGCLRRHPVQPDLNPVSSTRSAGTRSGNLRQQSRLGAGADSWARPALFLLLRSAGRVGRWPPSCSCASGRA
jgi:ActR/RegA family two-component response regulator